ncbi:hypothetical protein AB0E96_27900 [Kitasatospora sp. NPDC036755]|uniref:hypothetical protein n=1 Tax=Kitasatospora sp. NPDC036755 TaxID=3154600 RepID=UPI0033FD2858
MTSLHPAATDPFLPGPPRGGAGSSPPSAAPGTAAAAAPMCSIATATEPGSAPSGATEGAARLYSVPQPRSRHDAEAPTAPAAVGVVPEVSAAPAISAVEAPRALAGADGDGDGAGFVRFGPTTVPPEGGTAGTEPRPTREEPRILGSRRPSPSRRLRRMHPQAARTGQGATARETAAPGPTGTGLPGATGRTDDRAGAAWPAGATAQLPSFGTGAGVAGHGGAVGPAGGDDATATATGDNGGASRAEPPLGILIGGTPGPAEALGRPEERAPVRVAARPIKVGRGTCLVVLPSWRPAIAVSVPTELLLSATGLGIEQLAGARLTVLMNPAALHDRELELHGWEPGPAGRTRRGGRG